MCVCIQTDVCIAVISGWAYTGITQTHKCVRLPFRKINNFIQDAHFMNGQLLK